MARRLTTSSLTISTFVAIVSVVCRAQSLPPLTRHVPTSAITGQAPSVGRLPATQSLRLVLVLPLSNQAALDALLQKLYDPSGPSYRQFLTVEQFTAMFGPSQEDYNRVISFAEANGFTVVGTSRNRLNIDVTAPVATIEQTFHVTMSVYRHPTENRTFYAPDREPAPNMGVQLWHIAGLDNESTPRPALRRKSGAGSTATIGSGPSSSFLGSDMRAAYYGGTLTGAGQSLGLLEFYGTDLTDLNTYFTNVKQTNKVPITLKSTDGTSTSCLESKGCDDTEQTIDMTQALGMAPGLSSLVVYVGSTDVAIFNAMATASPLNAQLSSSWIWSPPDANTDNPYFEEFAAQGQNLFQAAGDSGAWETGSTIFPADDVYVTSVGGTDLQTSKAGGPRTSETAWVDGGGGISPNQFAIPSWQTSAASGCSTCSQTYRNGPDVSANANFSFYVCADQTTCTANEYGGTSFAAPMWAGYMALVNEQAVSNGGHPRGFINPTLYAIGSSTSYNADFHDITSGSNGYSATTGYDLATGWGSPNGSGLLNSLVMPPGFSLTAAPASVSVVQGTNAVYTVTVVPAGGFASNVSLSVSGMPSGASGTFSANPIVGFGTSTLSVSTSNPTPGTYTLTITGSAGGINQTSSVMLTITPPPVAVSVAPSSAILYTSQTQQFTATVRNTTNTAVTWSLNPNIGTISSSGLFTAPSTIGAQQAITVTATSVADTTKSATATIILVPPASWYSLSWTSRKSLAIDHTKVSGSSSLSNFPVLVSVTNASLATVANGGNVGLTNGSDILFTASDGATKLNHEIEQYNPATGQLIAWVQVPSLSAAADTVIYIYYGNAAASNQQNASGVWDSNYMGVWHLANGTTLNAGDSTANANNGSATSVSPTSGEIDGAGAFNGSPGNISIPTSASLSPTSALTLSAWINLNSASGMYVPLANWDDVDGNLRTWFLWIDNGTPAFYISHDGSGAPNITATNNPLSANSWYYLTGTFDGNQMNFYINGANVGALSSPGGIATNSQPTYIGKGRLDLTTLFFNGVIDEVRVSKSARSAAWIATEYNNQSAPSTFLSLGSQQGSGAVTTPAFSPAAGTYTSAQSVVISTSTPGASIRYTTDGSTPSETAGTLYTGPIPVSATTTLNAIAYETGLLDSVVASASYTITGSNWYNTGWSDRTAITIHHTKVSGSSSLSNFPVLVSVTNASLATVANGGNVGLTNGSDILFTASDGATKLNHEIEQYNPATGQLIAWVQVPSLSAAADTVIYIYYGNAAASNQQNASAVWDSNYMGVWHLANGTTLNAGDSTANANNGSATSVSPTSGEIDGAGAFNGSPGNISIPTSASLSPTSALTLSAWINLNSASGMYVPLANWDDVDGNLRTWFLWIDNGTPAFYISHDGSGAPNITATNNPLSANSWYYLTGTFDGNQMNFYINGANVGALSSPGGIATNSQPTYIGKGRLDLTTLFFNGVIDEVRVSKSARSAAWIATEYNNQSAPSTFLSLGSQQGSGAVTTPAFSPAAGTYTSAQSVVISTSTPGHRSVTPPTAARPARRAGTLYTGPIPVSATTTLNAIAYETGLLDSVMASASYTITGSNWYNTGWSDRTAITIHHTKVSGSSSLSNFPVLVSVTNASLATVANGGNVGLTNGSDILLPLLMERPS